MLIETLAVSSVLPMLGTLLVICFFYWYYRPADFPGGPRGIPLLGVIPFLGNHPPKKLYQWSRKYGPVMSVRMGRTEVVMLTGGKTIIEAFVTKSDAFSGRPLKHVLYEIFHQNMGISFLDYNPRWKSLRQFAVRTLKGVNVRRENMEERIADEVEHLGCRFTQKKGKAFNPQHDLMTAVANVICLIMLGKRFSYDDQEFQNIIKIFDDSFTQGQVNFLFFMTMFEKTLRFVPPFRGAYLQIGQHLEELRGFIRKQLDHRLEDFNVNDIRDFSDAFIAKMNKSKGTEEEAEFQIEQLLHFVQDLLVAGIETTSSSLRWAIICLLQDPSYQEKMHQEIENVIGENEVPRLRHKLEMPYTKAFLQETRRYRGVIPLTPSHKTTKDITLNGFLIPKNTEVVANQWSVNHDPKIWDFPDTFSPKRHLDGNGKFIPSTEVMSFSIGPRHCLGQEIGQAELFLFLVSIVQKFKICVDADSSNPPTVNNGRHGSAFVPDPFEVILQPRN